LACLHLCTEFRKARRAIMSIVFLRCRGELPGNRFLDGRTHDGTVGLAPHTGDPFTGTRWDMRKIPGTQDEFVLKCLGAVEGNRFLDGRTHDGTVGLAPDTTEPFTGTRWKATRSNNGITTIKCLGAVEGNRFLDGRTHDGTVGLAPNTDAPFSGTRWAVEQVPD
jgi:hypothetical protein